MKTDGCIDIFRQAGDPRLELEPEALEGARLKHHGSVLGGIGSDVGSDVGFDAGSDVVSDVGSDVGFDVGPDAGSDVGSDVGPGVARDNLYELRLQGVGFWVWGVELQVPWLFQKPVT